MKLDQLRKTQQAVKLNEQTGNLAPEQLEWLKKHGLTHFNVNADGSIDVLAAQHFVHLDNMAEERFPVKFNHVACDFHCSNGNLTTLEGSPSVVDGDFVVTRLPKLKSLVGGPRVVKGIFAISSDHVVTLEGVPAQVGELYIDHNDKIKSLQNIHKVVKSIGTNNDGKFFCTGTPIKSNVLGLLMIKNLAEVKGLEAGVEAIVNKHLVDKDVHACQEELIDAGLAEFAKL
jgi:hypothetical protein